MQTRWLIIIWLLASTCFAKSVPTWKAMPFTDYKSKRLLITDKRVYHYRAELGSDLRINSLAHSKLKISAMSVKKYKKLSLTLYIDEVEKKYVLGTDSAKYNYQKFQDILINLNPAEIHTIRIVCPIKDAYFRVFYEAYTEKMPTGLVILTPPTYHQTYPVSQGAEPAKAYYSSCLHKNVIFQVIGPKHVFGFAKAVNPTNDSKFNISIDYDKKAEINISKKISTSFKIDNSKLPLGVGKKFDFFVPAGIHNIHLSSSDEILYRLYIKPDKIKE